MLILLITFIIYVTAKKIIIIFIVQNILKIFVIIAENLTKKFTMNYIMYKIIYIQIILKSLEKISTIIMVIKANIFNYLNINK